MTLICEVLCLLQVPATITVDVVEQTVKKMMGRKYFTHARRNGRRSRCVVRKIKESVSIQSCNAC